MVSVVEVATYDVPWLHLNRFGTNRVALQGTMRAAVGESAAWTWIHRRGDFTLDGDVIPGAFVRRIGFRVRLDEQTRVRMLWFEEDRVRWSKFDNLAKVHHCHPVRHVADHRQVVCDEEQR